MAEPATYRFAYRTPRVFACVIYCFVAFGWWAATFSATHSAFDVWFVVALSVLMLVIVTRLLILRVEISEGVIRCIDVYRSWSRPARDIADVSLGRTRRNTPAIVLTTTDGAVLTPVALTGWRVSARRSEAALEPIAAGVRDALRVATACTADSEQPTQT